MIFEYKTITMEYGSVLTNEDLNKLGLDGWDLITTNRLYKKLNKLQNDTLSFNFVTEYIFKKIKTDKEVSLLTD
jgi:hypothetical protein